MAYLTFNPLFALTLCNKKNFTYCCPSQQEMPCSAVCGKQALNVLANKMHDQYKNHSSGDFDQTGNISSHQSLISENKSVN
jgi:hypothetical protein